MTELSLDKINNILKDLCIAANAFDSEFQPQFDCYIESLNFNRNLLLDDNFKRFFINDSSWTNMKKMNSSPPTLGWDFQMKNIGTPYETMSYFFRKNLFYTLNDKQFEVVLYQLTLYLENLTGEFIYAQQGYIRPPNEYLPAYVQHWQHLYLKGQDAEILITFEANT